MDLRSKVDPWRRRMLAMAVLCTAGFVVLLGQLWYLQALEGDRLVEMSDKNRIRVRPVAAPRGILFDRSGLPLVDNRPAFTLSAIPREMEDRDTVLARLAVVLKTPISELSASFERVPADSIRPVRLRRGLTLEDVILVEERRAELPGVIVEIEPVRVYPTTTFAAHLLGYVREVSDEQLRAGRYRRGDMIGQSGLERILDEHLRGQDGGERIEVDAMGRTVRVLEHQEPRPGAQVITTVDRRIQEAAERAMEGKSGAVVVLDPRDGDVLAMVSTPAYPLDRLTGNLNREEWLALVRDPKSPLMNRVLQSQYAPGSVFKVVVAAAGLQEATITPMDRTYCNGEFHLGGWTFHDWKEGGHGHVDTRQALVQSCNIFFYQAGLRVGAEAMARYARAFGLGVSPGSDLGGEKAGFIPFAEGRRGRRGWQAGETVNMAIGQGRVLVTPLQIARMMGAVANGGVLWKPRLVQRVEQPDGTLAYSAESRATGRVDLSPVVWAFLRSALTGVVSEGTGAAARLPGILVAGKTGTAQSAARDAKGAQDHAWFASYAPADNPQAVVVVLVERGGKGGQVAAPIAKQIYQAMFLDRVAMVTLGEDLYSGMLRVDRRLLQNVDWQLLATALLIVALGLSCLWSLAPPGRTGGMLLWRQLSWVGVGMFGLLVMMSLDYRNLVRVAPALYVGGLALLVSALVLGRTVSGARRWLHLGPVTIQPSELFKLAFVLILAWILTARRDQPLSRGVLGSVFVCMAVPFVLVMKQPDLGTALLLIPVLSAVLVGAGLSLRVLGSLAAAGLAAMPLVWFVLKPYQRDRLLVYLDPLRDPLGAAYNVIQAKIAIGSGQLLGRGVSGATQSRLAFLPERHTDFIFAVFAETWGFVGCLVLIGAYTFLVLRGFEIAAVTREPCGRLLALGVTAVLAVQTLINLGMVTGLLPIVGIPLPLMSYGGSSMVVSLMGLGLLLSVRMRQFQ